MINTILIPQIIYRSLKEDETVKNIVSSKIYPLAAENGTDFPFIIFTRDSIQELTNTKDGLSEDRVTFTVTCVHDKYFECLKLAQAVREAIEKRKIADESVELLVRDIELLSISESYSENAYIEELNFQADVTPYHKEKE